MSRTRKDPQSVDEQKTGRQGRPLTVWLRTDLAEALAEHVDQSRPQVTKTAIIEMLLEQFLREQGRLS